MQAEDEFSLELKGLPAGLPACGISNEEHVRTAVDLLLDAFDETTVNETAIHEALHHADQLPDPVLAAGAKQVIEMLARTRMLQPSVNPPATS